MVRHRLARALAAAAALMWAGCARPGVPDPRSSAAAYADAIQKGDDAAVYELLAKRDQQALGRDGVRRLLAENKRELSEQVKKVGDPATRVQARARFRLSNGEVAELALQGGSFHVEAAGSLPMNPGTPAQALEEFRRGLSERNYAAILRLFSKDTQGAVEGEVKGLVEGLENPETLELKIDGDDAVAKIPGGHRIRLKREAGVWRVDDIE